MRISDWSSDVCSSDLVVLFMFARKKKRTLLEIGDFVAPLIPLGLGAGRLGNFINGELWGRPTSLPWGMIFPGTHDNIPRHPRSEEHTSELQSLMRISYAVFCLKKKKKRAAVHPSSLSLHTLCKTDTTPH